MIYYQTIALKYVISHCLQLRYKRVTSHVFCHTLIPLIITFAILKMARLAT